MKRILWVSAALVLVAASAATCAVAADPPPAPETLQVTILHVNDTHGRLEPHTVAGKSLGGYARLATLVADVRAAGGAARVFLVDAGDVMSRGDSLTRRTLGRANVALMNLLAFDAWTLGNGDFYNGVQNLQARIREARFPVLAANVAVKATGQPVAKPFVIEKAGPVRVAFLGLCTVSDDHPSAKAFAPADALVTAADLVPKLRQQADVVVALSHLGVINDHHLAVTVPGIDLIVGGHTHTVLPEGVRFKGPGGDEVLIVQAGEWLEYLGRVDLTCRRADGRWRVAESAARLIPIDGKVRMDPAVTALIAKMAEESGGPAPKRDPTPAPPLPDPRPQPAETP